MKRLHLFEFEDFPWFPALLRTYLTRYLLTVHRLLHSSTHITGLLRKLLAKTDTRHIIDLCSGSGGPMIDVVKELRGEFPKLKLTLSDLYPDLQTANKFNGENDGLTHYYEQPVDATQVPSDLAGIRTLVCSFHHLDPASARQVLLHAVQNNQPILIYEISDNSFPKWLWWLAFPINIITVLLLTLAVRPLHIGHLVFTYLIPILPLIIAWDGAVSNARTYTLQDLDTLLSDIPQHGYHWDKGTIPGKGGAKLYLMGYPQ